MGISVSSSEAERKKQSAKILNKISSQLMQNAQYQEQVKKQLIEKQKQIQSNSNMQKKSSIVKESKQNQVFPGKDQLKNSQKLNHPFPQNQTNFNMIKSKTSIETQPKLNTEKQVNTKCNLPFCPQEHVEYSRAALKEKTMIKKKSKEYFQKMQPEAIQNAELKIRNSSKLNKQIVNEQNSQKVIFKRSSEKSEEIINQIQSPINLVPHSRINQQNSRFLFESKIKSRTPSSSKVQSEKNFDIFQSDEQNQIKIIVRTPEINQNTKKFSLQMATSEKVEEKAETEKILKHNEEIAQEQLNIEMYDWRIPEENDKKSQIKLKRAVPSYSIQFSNKFDKSSKQILEETEVISQQKNRRQLMKEVLSGKRQKMSEDFKISNICKQNANEPTFYHQSVIPKHNSIFKTII